MLLEGKKAIVTGGTRGIGYAIACRFIEEGAAVTVFGSRQETADAAVEKLAATYPDAKIWGRSCDLTSLEAVTEAFTQAAADMGGLDTVVNNAGISQRSPLLDYTAEEFAKVMDINVVAVFNGHQAAAKIMTEAGHGGTITTTSSMVAKYGQPSGVGYPTSKFAVNGMVQSLSRELAPMGIRVNAESLASQLEERGCPERAELPFQRDLLNGNLPLTMGGGIGQSRMCMFFLRKAHIGEVQASIWPQETVDAFRAQGVCLL